MKTLNFGFVNYMAAPQRAEPEVDVRRPRNAKMDQFLSQINGSPRYDVMNVAARVSQALAKSKKAA